MPVASPENVIYYNTKGLFYFKIFEILGLVVIYTPKVFYQARHNYISRKTIETESLKRNYS